MSCKFAKKLNKHIQEIQEIHIQNNLCYLKNSDFISKKISKHLLKIESILGKEVFINFYITPETKKHAQISTFAIFINSKVYLEEELLKKLSKLKAKKVYSKFIHDVEIANNHLSVMPTIFPESYSFIIQSNFQKF